MIYKYMYGGALIKLPLILSIFLKFILLWKWERLKMQQFIETRMIIWYVRWKNVFNSNKIESQYLV